MSCSFQLTALYILFAGLFVFCDKVIEREDADMIRRYLSMTKIEQIFFEEQQEAVDKAKKEIPA